MQGRKAGRLGGPAGHGTQKFVEDHVELADLLGVQAGQHLALPLLRFADRFLDHRFGENRLDLPALNAQNIAAFMEYLVTRRVREFKTATGVISFLVGIGFAQASIPMKNGETTSHRLVSD
jgi:hypothetical protein